MAILQAPGHAEAPGRWNMAELWAGGGRQALRAVGEQSVLWGTLDMAREAEVFEVGEDLGDSEAPVVEAAQALAKKSARHAIGVQPVALARNDIVDEFAPLVVVRA